MSNGPLPLPDSLRMPAPDGPALPVANCVLCGWPMDGTVNILEVRIGTAAVYRACAGECPPADVSRWNAMDRRRYIDGRHAVAHRVQRQIATTQRLFPTEVGRLRDLQRRHSVLLGLDASQCMDVDPSSATGLPAADVVKRVRDHLRERGWPSCETGPWGG